MKKEKSIPESKEVESVAVKSAEEILENVFPITLGILGIGWHQIDDEQKQDLISAMETYASQFKQPANNEAVKVIEERIKKLEATPTGWQDSERMILIEELKHILKLVQS